MKGEAHRLRSLWVITLTNLSAAPIVTIAEYNASSINGYETADTLHLTLSLKKKTDITDIHDNITSVEYNSVSMLDHFSGNVVFESGQSKVTAPLQEDIIDVYLPLTGVEVNEIDGVYYVNISYNVITGAGLTYYANYMVDVSAELYKNNAKLDNSNASDYLVYTNAKVVPTELRFSN